MRRVMSEEPERLRALVPHLPRDLETIVHKAIDRDPARRYATAAALAEDLQRFLDDRPIRARRVTAAEQGWRWARRNRAVASLAAGLLLALVAGLVGVTWQWRQAVANLRLGRGGQPQGAGRFDLAMEAVQAFTTGASEDVILKEKALEGLRKKLLGQSRLFYEKLTSVAGGRDRPGLALGPGGGPLRRGQPVWRGQRAGRGAGGFPGALALRGYGARAAGGPRRAAGPGPRPSGGRSTPAPVSARRGGHRAGTPRGILRDSRRSTPRMGARLLEAVCDGQDGERLYRLDRHDEAETAFSDPGPSSSD